MKVFTALCVTGLITAGFLAAAGPRTIDFNRDIHPILSDTCFTCHGPDEKQRMAGLRLDTKEGALAKVIVPGKARESLLYQRISASNKAQRMPPPSSGRSLTDEQIEKIRKWIDQGAQWDTHWAFRPPRRPPLPSVKAKSWPKNAIDYFILARLEQEGLKPAPEADRATLLRRVTLDLTGLPPTLAELDAFLKDKSPGAYQKVVDRLLDSPRYGERMAMEWLDVARYADTHGYHIDSHRDMWRWRDWVVEAFNQNMRFDQFTIEQLAGDLLPKPTRSQLIATGFNRNHMINFEGGAIPEEYLNEYVVDRVETTSTAWMGLTMGCARCHDHKYDPIRQQEFYRFYAFFNTVEEKGLDGRTGNAEPYLQLSTPEQERRLEMLTHEINTREKALDDSAIGPLRQKWEATRASSLPDAPRQGLLAHYEFDGNLADASGHYLYGKPLRGEVVYSEGRIGGSAIFSGETHVALGAAGAWPGEEAFSLAFWMRYAGRTEMALLQKIADGETRTGFEVLLDESVTVPDQKRAAHLYVRLTHRWPDDAIEIRTRDRLIQNDWYHLAIVYDGSRKAAGVKLYLNGKPAEVDVIRDSLSGSIGNSSRLEIGNKNLYQPYKGQTDDLRIYGRPLSAEEAAILAIHLPVKMILAGFTGKKSKQQKELLRDYFLTYDAPEQLRSAYAELADFKEQKKHLIKVIPTTMIMKEMEKPRETFVLGRGDYRNRGEKVTPGVPSVLPQMPESLPRNRLGLANWLIDPSHPLTARVMVNRYWQMYFGNGLVKTSENFGSQGEPPSHPELLDWLATEFIRSGWDIKAMQRLIVTSATYRQSSRLTPELAEKDPENRLLARGPRFRLPAEIVRDNALAAGGLLNGEMGGPGVYPYQPKGVWEEIAYGDVFSAQTYTPSKGKDLYRRSMYTFWKRTAPPPSLVTFDAPDREKCIARRSRTNTPLQALVLMNDPTYVEAARALAQRMIMEGGGSAERRIRLGFRICTARTPTPAEVRVLKDLESQQRAFYSRNQEAALKLLRVGESPFDSKLDVPELAAWTTVASTILNMDETITKE